MRLAAAAQGVILAAERAGKIKTVLQLFCLSLFLAKQALDHDLAFFLPNAPTLYHTEIADLTDWISIGASVTLVAATILTVTSGISYLWRHGNLFFGEQAE